MWHDTGISPDSARCCCKPRKESYKHAWFDQTTAGKVYRFKPAWSEAFPEKLHALLKKSGITSRETVCKRCRIFWAIFEILCKDHCWCGCNWQHTMESRAMQITMHEEMRSMHSTLKDTISPATAKSVF